MDHWKQSPEVAAQVAALTAAASELQRGDTLLWSVCERVTGLDREDTRFRYVVNKWRRNLQRDSQIETWPQVNVGIKLLTDEECVRLVPALRGRKAARQHLKIGKAAKNARTSLLSNNERLLQQAIIESSAAARKSSLRVSAVSKASSDRVKLLEVAEAMHTNTETSCPNN